MKPANLNQLLFQSKISSLSFFQSPIKSAEEWEEFDRYILDMEAQLRLQGKSALAKILVKNKNHFVKLLKSNPKLSYGFFLSEKIQGYMALEGSLETFCIISNSFHVRPILEELFVNPEYIIVNISMYDVKVFRGDFQHIEIIQHYEFDQVARDSRANLVRVYAPQYLGLVPYKTMLALKSIASKIRETTQYHSTPVIVTGIGDMKENFLKYFDNSYGIFTHFEEDFYENTCVQILEKCKTLRPMIMDYYSSELKDRLKKMVKSKRLISDLGTIVKAVSEEKVVHLVLPTQKKVWGVIDLETGEFEIHKKMKKRDPSVDILNELADAVIKQGGKIQVLPPHFFPQDSYVIAILKG